MNGFSNSANASKSQNEKNWSGGDPNHRKPPPCRTPDEENTNWMKAQGRPKYSTNVVL